VLAEIRRFFEDYKKLEQRSDVVVEEILDLESARKIIDDAIKVYSETFGNKA
jgi:inorganic pyrophosphatase